MSNARRIYDAAGTADKTLYWAEEATHYYRGQSELLLKTSATIKEWLNARGR
jgi:hypothetical protein